MDTNDQQHWPPNIILTATANMVLVLLDTQANIVNINPYGCQLLEYRLDQLIGKNWLDFCVTKDQQTEVTAIFQHIINAESKAEHCRNSVVSQSGKRYLLAWHNAVSLNESGSIFGVLSSGINITKPATREQQALVTLQTSEKRARIILDNVIEGIVASDANGTIISFNKSAETLFGYTNSEILGKNVSLLMPSSHRQRHSEYIRQYLANGTANVIGSGRELIGIRKEGDHFPIHLTIADAITDGEHLFIDFIRDLTQQKSTEQQLRDKESDVRQSRERLAHITRVNTLGEITAGIAHEINQPLAAITTYAQAAHRLTDTPTDDTDELKYVLRQIERQAMRAGQIIHRVRNLAKPGANKRSHCKINTIISDTLALIATEATSNNVSFKCHLGIDLPFVDVDTVQIQQILLNLILNAIQAMETTPPSRRLITLTSRRTDDNKLRVSVVDTGPGISTDHKDQVFLPFFTTRNDGLGIGLSICRTLITAHGGSLNVNRRKRKGSEFFFLLPVIETTGEETHG